MPSLSAGIEVGAPPDRVKAVITDFARYPEILPLIRAARVLRREPGAWEVALSAELIQRVDFTLRFEEEGESRLRWLLVEGRFHSLEGAWELSERPGGCLARCTLDLQPGLYLPGGLVESLRRYHLPELLDRIRRRAEGPLEP